jgi:hypothetical protein
MLRIHLGPGHLKDRPSWREAWWKPAAAGLGLLSLCGTLALASAGGQADSPLPQLSPTAEAAPEVQTASLFALGGSPLESLLAEVESQPASAYPETSATLANSRMRTCSVEPGQNVASESPHEMGRVASLSAAAVDLRTSHAMPSPGTGPGLDSGNVEPALRRRRRRRRPRRLRQSQIRRAVARQRSTVDRCQAREARRIGGTSNLRVVLHLSVAPDGSVTRSAVGSPSLRDTPLGKCLARGARRWQFPRAHEASSFDIPFVWASGRR